MLKNGGDKRVGFDSDFGLHPVFMADHQRQMYDLACDKTPFFTHPSPYIREMTKRYFQFSMLGDLIDMYYPPAHAAFRKCNVPVSWNRPFTRKRDIDDAVFSMSGNGEGLVSDYERAVWEIRNVQNVMIQIGLEDSPLWQKLKESIFYSLWETTDIYTTLTTDNASDFISTHFKDRACAVAEKMLKRANVIPSEIQSFMTTLEEYPPTEKSIGSIFSLTRIYLLSLATEKPKKEMEILLNRIAPAQEFLIDEYAAAVHNCSARKVSNAGEQFTYSDEDRVYTRELGERVIDMTRTAFGMSKGDVHALRKAYDAGVRASLPTSSYDSIANREYDPYLF